MNLLPLSNVRLEIDESDAKNNNVIQERSDKEAPNRGSKSNPTVISVSTKNKEDGEKCFKHRPTVQITEIDEIPPPKIGSDDKKLKNRKNSGILDTPSKNPVADKGITSFPQIAREKRSSETVFYTYDNNFDLLREKGNQQATAVVESYRPKTEEKLSKKEDLQFNEKNTLNINPGTNQSNIEKHKVEETEDTKSLWISDNEEIEEMSRRPQVLKVIDNDVTKSKNPKKSINIDVQSADNDVTFKENIYENTTSSKTWNQTFKISNKPDLINDHIHEAKIKMDSSNVDKEKERITVENARSFFEKKSTDEKPLSNRNNEGRFEKIVKETSSILGKACNVVKGSLGFEARSESSDLGLGSEIGSDIRRLSVDENTNINERHSEQKQLMECTKQYDNVNEKNQKNYTNLTRSRSCIDSIEICQDSDEPEFDHVRYKIVKSNMFGKNAFNISKRDVTYDGLMQYLQEYSFQDLLTDNKVVIIEPVRAEVERKPSFNDSKLKSSLSCKVSKSSLEKLKSTESDNSDKDSEKKTENHFKTPRQSSLRKHFFYQPIRVNRELNDDELPDPDTVRNVRKMFEETMKEKLKAGVEIARECSTRKSISMKDLRMIESRPYDTASKKSTELSRYLYKS